MTPEKSAMLIFVSRNHQFFNNDNIGIDADTSFANEWKGPLNN